MVRILAIFLLVFTQLSASAEQHAAGRFVISTDKSWIRVLVMRAGLLSGLGHNHVVASHDIAGTIDFASRFGESAVEFEFPVTKLEVDDPESRDAEGDEFSGRVSEKDIRGTRKNMLGQQLLRAETYPLIVVRSTTVSGTIDQMTVTADVEILGHTRSIVFPATASVTNQQLEVSGEMRITHADLGLTPFSAAFGTLKVADEMTIRFLVVAYPTDTTT